MRRCWLSSIHWFDPHKTKAHASPFWDERGLFHWWRRFQYSSMSRLHAAGPAENPCLQPPHEQPGGMSTSGAFVLSHIQAGHDRVPPECLISPMRKAPAATPAPKVSSGSLRKGLE